MMVAKITQEQADEIRGKEFNNGNLYNPIQDKHGNWIISLTELQFLGIDFSKTVELIEYEPIEISLHHENTQSTPEH